jgi:peptide deformylase
MIKDIIAYPTPPSVEYATDVRNFDESIKLLENDLIDTINANNLDGLAAFQIGNFYNVIVVKIQNQLTTMINPRIIGAIGEKVTTTETTAYFPNLSAEVTRSKQISVVFQDIQAKSHSLKLTGNEAIVTQRKIDYTFGSSFINKLSNEQKAIFEQKLEFGSDKAIAYTCPTKSYKDYILNIANITTAIIAILLIISLFISNTSDCQTIWQYQKYTSYITLLLGFIYLIYGYYEGKSFSSCTSCQIGNLIGTTLILFVRLSILMVLSYFIVI